MQPQEAAPSADQRVRWDTGPGGNLALSTRYRQEYGLWIAEPVDPAARWTLKTRSCTLKRGGYSLKMVLSAIAFHGRSISRESFASRFARAS
jgi:hypothetical protein